MNTFTAAIKHLPLTLLFVLVKFGYKRKGKTLKKLTKLQNGRFWIYNIEGCYVAAQHINWYVDYSTLEADALRVPLWHYRLKPGNCVIDLGAGIGEECVVFSKLVGESGKVHSIEANPNVFKVLEEVVTLNKLKNVKAYQLALSEANGTIVLEDDIDSYLSSAQVQKQAASTYKVKGITFDAFMQSIGNPEVHFLKCNIEGAERFLLGLGASSLLQIRHLAISCHDFRFYKERVEFYKTKELVCSYLKENGYSIYTQQTAFDFVNDWIYAEKQ